MKKEKNTVFQLLDLTYLQLLQDNFAKVTKITALLVDPDGHALTQPSETSGAHSKENAPKVSVEPTVETIRLCAENSRTGQPATMLSPSTGLTTAAIPVFWEDEHVASWIISQVQLIDADGTPVNTASRRRQGAQVSALPGLTTEVFADVFFFFTSISHAILQLTKANLEASKTNAELLELTEKLDLTAHMLSRLTNSTDVATYVSDFFTGEILMANEKYASFTGLTPQALIGTQCWRTVDDSLDTFCSYCKREQLLSDDGEPNPPIVWENYLAKHDKWLRLTDQALYWMDGRLAHMVTFVDITQERQLHEQLAQLAFYDRGMQMPNALKLNNDLRETASGKDLFVICFDILSLRKINEAYTRVIGDALLRAVCSWISDLQVKDSTLYRIDGDSFCFLPKGLNQKSVDKLAKKIFTRFEEPWILSTESGNLHVFCNVTMGVINAGKHFTDIDTFLNLIDSTLDFARRDGKIAVHSKEMDEAFKNHILLELSLKQCVKDGMKGFEVHYQPIVDPTTGQWCGMEALCRWNSPEFGNVPPLVFIQEAEQHGLIGTIGQWVLDTAVCQCKQWGLDEHNRFLLDVNLSPTQLLEENLVSNIIDILEKYDYPGEKLSLEITESTEFNFTDNNMSAIERLRNINVLVSLDDFGTGYSSFNNLKKLPVSILKTERVFIQDIENDSYLQYLLHVMIELAHAADMKLIAEGVENTTQMKVLMDSGADLMQGYLFSKPLPATLMEAQLGHFYTPDSTFSTEPPMGLEGAKLPAAEIASSASLYHLFSQCVQTLLGSSDTVPSIPAALELIGTQLALSRITMHHVTEDGYYGCIYEWCAPGYAPQQEAHMHVHLSSISPNWIPALHNDGLIAVSSIDELPTDMCDKMSLYGAKAALVLPSWSESYSYSLIGYTCFFDCENNRVWLPEEITMLRNLGLISTAILRKKKLQDKLISRSFMMDAVLDNMDIPLYVTEIDTGLILFANQKLRQLFDPSLKIEGQLCCELMWGSSAQCDNCQRRKMHTDIGLRGNSREMYSEKLQKHLRISGSIIPWNGRSAFMESFTDITELKQCQQKLEFYASSDALTATLNRQAILSQLQEMLRESFVSHSPLSLCYVDIDNLSQTNSSLGHALGDQMISKIVDALKLCVRKKDLIGRYTGDEFIVALYACKKDVAFTKIGSIHKQLIADTSDAQVPCSFSFGVVESTEVAFSDTDDYLHQLMDIAHSRMRQSKGDLARV